MDCDRSGSLLSERFYLKERLSEGGSGEIYLAEDRNCGDLQKKWVVKWVDRKKNGPWFECLKNEVRILESVQHPNMSTIHYYEEIEEGFFMVIDYIEGETAKDILKRDGNLSEDRVLKWMRTVCSVLSYLHTTGKQPIIYADLTPANLMISHEDTVYLLDYGISRELKDPNHYPALGTRGFAAPEQYIDGSGKLDERTDIYSVGATLFNLLTDQLPVDTDHPKKICSDITSATDTLVSKCLQHNPERRFQSIQELTDAIEAILVNLNGEQVNKRHQIIGFFLLLAILSLMVAVCSGMLWIRECQEAGHALELSGDEKLSKGDLIGAEKDYFLSLEKTPEESSIYKKLFRLMQGTYTDDEICEIFKEQTDYRYFDPEFALVLSMHCLEERTGQYHDYAENLLKQAAHQGNRNEKELAGVLMPFLEVDISERETERILKTFKELCEEEMNGSEWLYFLLKVSDRLNLSDAMYDQIVLKMEATLKSENEFYEIVPLYHLLMEYYYQKSQRLPENREAALEKAVFYSRQTELFATMKDKPEQAILRAKIYVESEQVEEAEAVLKRALNRNQDDRLILMELVRINLDRDVQKASDYFKQLTDLGKDDLSENLLNQINSLSLVLEMRGR